VQALAGFKPSGLAEAIELIQGCKDESAVAALETALQQKDVQSLESAINEAQALVRPMSRTDLLDDATRLCAELNDQAAVSALQTALEQRDVQSLERAIARGNALSPPVSQAALLVEAVRMHEELKIAEVSVALKRAVASADVDELGRAVTAATRFPAFMARHEEAVQQARGQLNEVLSSLLAPRTQKLWDTGDNDRTAATDFSSAPPPSFNKGGSAPPRNRRPPRRR